MYEISRFIMGIGLLFCSLSDIRKGGVRTWILVVMSVMTAVYILWFSGGSYGSALTGGMLGALFFALSLFSRESFGYADSWLVTILGVFMGGRNLLYLIVAAFFMAGLFSLAGILIKHWGKKKVLPFIPFLLLGYIGVLV